MEPDGQRQRSAEQATREETYAEIDRGSRIDGAFLQLVVLSTTIAAIGLRENSVAIIIAAMMIGRGSVAAACRYSWAYIGAVQLRSAAGAAASLAVNIVCVNLSAQMSFS